MLVHRVDAVLTLHTVQYLDVNVILVSVQLCASLDFSKREEIIIIIFIVSLPQSRSRSKDGHSKGRQSKPLYIQELYNSNHQ